MGSPWVRYVRQDTIAYEPRVTGWGITNGDWVMAACDLVKIFDSLNRPLPHFLLRQC